MKLLFLALSLITQINMESGDKPDNVIFRPPTPWEAAIPMEAREPYRTYTMVYNSEEEARKGSMAPSLYYQSLKDNQWTRGEEEESMIYETTFKVPFAWADREVFVRIGSASGAYTVHVNRLLVRNENPYSTAEFNVTKYVKEGVNSLSVSVSGSYLSKVAGPDLPPGAQEITGEIAVFSQPKIRIRDYTLKAGFAGDNTLLELGVVVKSHLLNDKKVTIHYKLLSPSGTEVAAGTREARFRMLSEDTVRFTARIAGAQRWSHETPQLYTLLLRTQSEGRYTEYMAYKVGLRTVEIQQGTILVNGYPAVFSSTEYKGIDNPARTGERLRAIKAGGYNMVKVDGMPQPPYFYSLCDEIGLYVCDQAAIGTSRGGVSRQLGGNASNDPQYVNFFTDRALSMYRCSQNHPSVVMFSIAQNSANGFNLYESYLAIKAAEKDRPVIYLDADGEWNSDVVSAATAKAHPGSVIDRPVFDIGKKELSFAPPVLEKSGTSEDTYVLRSRTNTTVYRGVISYRVNQGAKKVSQGSIPFELAPGEVKEYAIPAGDAKTGKKTQYKVTLDEAVY